MKSFYFLLLGSMIVTAAIARPAISLTQQVNSYDNSGDTSYRLIRSEANTYGYEIFVNKKLLIRQKNIPGLSGNTGFPSKAAAAKVARLVIRKLRQGIMPPTITLKELNELGINYKTLN